MTKVLLICSAGMSTSILENAVEKYINEKKLPYQIKAMSSQEAKQVVKNFDVLLLAPQVRYMQDDFKKLADKPIDVIPPHVYALAQASGIIQIVEKLVGEK